MLILQIAVGIVIGNALWWIVTHRKDLPTIGMIFFWQRHPILAKMVYALIYIVFLSVPVGVLVLVSLYRSPNRVRLTDNLPPDPPGYFYIRSMHRVDSDNPGTILRGGHCVADCDTDHPLWLVPKSPQ